MIESVIFSRWLFNNRIETAPRNVNQAGHYSPAGLADALSLPEVTTVVRDWETAGWLIEIEIEIGGEASISTYRSHRVAEASKIVSTITGSVKDRFNRFWDPPQTTGHFVPTLALSTHVSAPHRSVCQGSCGGPPLR